MELVAEPSGAPSNAGSAADREPIESSLVVERRGGGTHSVSCKWNICGFSTTKQKTLWSKYFEVGGYDCRLLVYPTGAGCAAHASSRRSGHAARPAGATPGQPAGPEREHLYLYIALGRPEGATPQRGAAAASYLDGAESHWLAQQGAFLRALHAHTVALAITRAQGATCPSLTLLAAPARASLPRRPVPAPLPPTGDSQALPGYVSVYLQISDPRSSSSKWDCFASYRLSVRCLADDTKSVHRDSWHRFSAKRKSHGWCDFAALSTVLEPRQGFLGPGDTIQVRRMRPRGRRAARWAAARRYRLAPELPARARSHRDGPPACMR